MHDFEMKQHGYGSFEPGKECYEAYIGNGYQIGHRQQKYFYQGWDKAKEKYNKNLPKTCPFCGAVLSVIANGTYRRCTNNTQHCPFFEKC